MMKKQRSNRISSQVVKRVALGFLSFIGAMSAVLFPFILHKWLKLIFIKIHTYRVASQLNKAGRFICIGFSVKVIGGKSITIGDSVVIGERSILSVWKRKDLEYDAEIVIGNGTSFGEDCHITAINRIEIGRNVLMGKCITITDNSHGSGSLDEIDLAPIDRCLVSKGAVIIGNNVWIGDKATILPGITIGENVIVGANSVVTKSFPPNVIVAGNPAKIIGCFK